MPLRLRPLQPKHLRRRRVADRAYFARYYREHREGILEKAGQYSKAHSAQHLAASRRYYAANRAKAKAAVDKWRLANPERRILAGARQRCTNPNNPAYASYGGRGIQFRLGVEELLSTLGPRPSRTHSLDRIDNDGHYEIGNVRWATAKEQAANRR